ncbi:hypothetical protein D3C86_2207940 [compost metagenome]
MPASDGTKNAFITEVAVMRKAMGRSTGAASSLTVAMPCSGYRNSHFQSIATTSTVSGFTSAATGLPGSSRVSGR